MHPRAGPLIEPFRRMLESLLGRVTVFTPPMVGGVNSVILLQQLLHTCTRPLNHPCGLMWEPLLGYTVLTPSALVVSIL